jgi:hypothetical protein
MPTKRNSDKQTYDEDLEFTQDRVRDEDRLIGDRFSWLLNSQTIFLASYAILLQLNQQNGIILPVIALGTCAINYISIMGAVLSIYKYCKKLNKDHEGRSAESRWKILGSTLTHVMGQSSPIFIPLGFLGVWIFILFGSLTTIISISTSLVLLIFLWILNFPHTKNVGRKA